MYFQFLFLLVLQVFFAHIYSVFSEFIRFSLNLAHILAIFMYIVTLGALFRFLLCFLWTVHKELFAALWRAHKCNLPSAHPGHSAALGRSFARLLKQKRAFFVGSAYLHSFPYYLVDTFPCRFLPLICFLHFR